MSFEHVHKANQIDTSFRPGGMIRMLDYRASKLYRLLGLPIRIASIAFELTIIAICVLISGQWSGTLAYRAAELRYIASADIHMASLVIHIVIGIVFTIVVLVLWSALWNIAIVGIFNKLFLFFIDVVPSEGRSYPQALSVLQYGDMARLTLKMEYPETWTDSDTNEYVKRLPLVVRLTYGDQIRTRLPQVIAIFDKAKRDGVDLSNDTLEIKRRLKPLNDTISKGEKLIVNFRGAFWLVAIFAICLIVYYR